MRSGGTISPIKLPRRVRRVARRPRTLSKSQIFSQDVPTKPLFNQVIFDLRDEFSGLNV